LRRQHLAGWVIESWNPQLERTAPKSAKAGPLLEAPTFDMPPHTLLSHSS